MDASESPFLILVVCTGNTCRSPMAESLLRHALAAEKPPLNAIEVRSAGMAAFPGDSASENAVRAMAKVGLDISAHRSTPLSQQLIDASTLILTMTQSHADAIVARFGDPSAPLFPFMNWSGEHFTDIPDPVGGQLSHYLETRDTLAAAIPPLLAYLRTRYPSS